MGGGGGLRMSFFLFGRGVEGGGKGVCVCVFCVLLFGRGGGRGGGEGGVFYVLLFGRGCVLCFAVWPWGVF